MCIGLKIQRISNNLTEEGYVRGIIHFHSDFSYDGHDSITNLVAFLKKNGYSFACLAEHDDDFDDEKMKRFVNACKDASDNAFKMIPGLEFRCRNKAHILGLGIKEYFHADDPVDAAKKIKEQGGVAIIAHPIKYVNNITDELLSSIDGIEIWNGPKDSRFMPHYKSLVYYKKIKDNFPHIKASCGPDMHSIKRYFKMDMVAQSFSGDIKSIWIKSNPEMEGKYFTLSVNGKGWLAPVVTLFFMRGLLNAVKFLRDIIIKSEDKN